MKAKALIPKVAAVSFEAKFNETDLVTVAVAKGERILKNQLTAKKAEIEETKNLITKNKSGQTKMLKNMLHPFKAAVAELNKTLKKITKDDSFSISSDFNNEYDYKLEKHVLKNRFSVSFSRKTIAAKFLPLTKAQKDAIKEEEDLGKALKELQKSALEIKRKISDIPMLERQMRAKVMEAQLKMTDEGSALLDQLLEKSGLDSSLKLLGI